MLDTLPVATPGEATSPAEVETDPVVELNVDGASKNVIAWDNWWQLKEETN